MGGVLRCDDCGLPFDRLSRPAIEQMAVDVWPCDPETGVIDGYWHKAAGALGRYCARCLPDTITVYHTRSERFSGVPPGGNHVCRCPGCSPQAFPQRYVAREAKYDARRHDSEWPGRITLDGGLPPAEVIAAEPSQLGWGGWVVCVSGPDGRAQPFRATGETATRAHACTNCGLAVCQVVVYGEVTCSGTLERAAEREQEQERAG